MEILPHTDDVAVEWPSLRDQEFCLEKPGKSSFPLHLEALLGKSSPEKAPKRHPNSSKKAPRITQEQEKGKGNLENIR